MTSTDRTGSALPGLSRRAFLGLTAAGVAGAVTGCGSGAASSFGNRNSLNLPVHLDPAATPGMILSKVPGVPPGIVDMPSPLPKLFRKPPGAGGTLTYFQVNWIAPPQPRNKSRYWQAVEKRLNVKYQPTLVPADGYDDKLATVLASGKLPDLTFLHTESANAQQAIKDGAFADLSDVLGGDKIKAYPQLANIPEFQWRASAIDNGIYGVPVDLPYVNAMHVVRQDWADKAGLPAQPENADEFRELMTAMSKQKGKYGFGAYAQGVKDFIDALFRVPNKWREDKGKLVSMYETDEFEAALRYTVSLWKGGAFHPDALSLADQGAKDRSLFDSGVTGWQVASADTWFYGGGWASLEAKNKGAKLATLTPFGHDGGKYAYPSSPGFYALVAVSADAASKQSRLEELLRIMNYFRAPLATEEGFFLRYGLEGVQYTMKKGVPTPITGTPEASDAVALNYTGLAPATFYYPNQGADVRMTIRYTEDLTRNTVKDPTIGLFAPSAAKSAASLQETIDDYVNGIASGRRPFSDLTKFRAAWRKQGGDQLRRELEKALAKRK